MTHESGWTTGSRRQRRLFTAMYLLALSLIALIAVMTQLLQQVSIESSSKATAVVNLAGRQRMLSQKIVWYADRVLHADAPSGELAYRMLTLVSRMEKAHRSLLVGRYRWDDRFPAASELNHLYYDDDGLDSRVVRFLTDARQFAAVRGAEREAAYLRLSRAADGPLLAELEEAAEAYQRGSEKQMHDHSRLLRYGLLALLAILVLEILLIFRPAAKRLAAGREALSEMAFTDSMTGCYNRRSMFEVAKTIMARNRRDHIRSALILFDIDRFKVINDTHGHAAGDHVIVRVAQLVQSTIRQSDVLGRIGGEEFAVLIPASDETQAMLLAEKLRSLIARTTVEWSDKKIAVTISLGVDLAAVDENDLDAMFQRADEALYRAKATGRNRVMAHSEYQAAERLA